MGASPTFVARPITQSHVAVSHSLLVVLREILRSRSVHTSDDDVITFVGLQRYLLDRSELLLTQSLNLLGEHLLWRLGRIDTRCLDGNDEVATVLDEHGGVETENTRLIGLRNIGENDVNHRHEHAVLLRMSSVLDDGDHIRSLLCHIDEITAGSLREFNSVNRARGTNKVGHVRDGGTRSATEIEHLASGLHVNVSHTRDDGGANLGSEGVPNAIFSLGVIDLVL